MAPVAPLGREQVIHLLQTSPLPLSFGSPHPSVMVLEQEGKFRLRELVVDRVEADAAAQAAHRARTPSWMPEHYYALGKPTGHIHAEADSLPALIDILRTIAWPDHW